MKLPLSHKQFRYIYGKVPRLCVDLLIMTEDGLLLTKRQITPWQGMWHFPGGTVQYRESLEQAVARVALDEVGLKVEIEKLLGPYEFLKSDLGPLHVVSIGFLVKIKSGRPSGSWQAEEIKFYKKIPPFMPPEQKQFLKKHKILKP